MVTIEIEQETYERLKELAKGFSTPNDVIIQLLDERDTNKTEYFETVKSRKITVEQIEKSYDVAKEVYENKISLKQAKNILEKAGMNEGSANIYIYVINHLREGNLCTRQVSSNAYKHWLEKFKNEDIELLRNAISSIKKNHEWLESIEQPINGKIVELLSEYKQYL